MKGVAERAAGARVQALLRELESLELELHHPGAGCSRGRLERLLHPEFREIGRSGRHYDRTTVLTFLEQQAVNRSVESTEFTVTQLAPDIALLTYRSAQRERDGTLSNHTYRSSVWAKTDIGWQLRYHQGTPAADSW